MILFILAETTFAHLFRRAGYTTCGVGKWQLSGHYPGSHYRGRGTDPKAAGFDDHCLWKVKNFGSRYWQPLLQRNGEVVQFSKNEFGPDICCDHLIDFIKTNHQNGQPFFAYYPMILTHSPFVPTPLTKTPYSEAEKYGRNGLSPQFFDDQVHYTDALVGRIFAALRDMGAADQP